MSFLEKSDEKLLQIYNDIDAFLRRECKRDKYADHGFLIQELARSNRVVNRYQQDLRAVAQLRNNLVHNPFGPKAQPMALPHQEVVKRYQAIRDMLLNPHTAVSIAILATDIYTATLETNLLDVLKKMDKNTYTHVPIMEHGRMIGILSENTLLSYLAENDDIIISKDMTVGDLAEYLPLNAHRSESFVFIPRDATLSDVFNIFNKAIHVHRRIGMVFVTHTGKPKEKLLGIITAWDLASPEFELQ